MDEYIGKICPFCKTAIAEGDAVTVCPACGIPHHTECWEENHGCTTFGCSQQHYQEQHTNPTDVCANCGAPLGDGQAFCIKCGTAKEVPASSVCGNCGTQLQPGQEYCPRCGCKAGMVVDSHTSAAIDQFNASLTQKKKNSKILPFVIAGVLVVLLALGLIIGKVVSDKKAEEAKEQYLEDMEEFLDMSYTAGTNLEDISDTVVQYWYEHIYYDKHGSSIDTAIMYALYDKSSEITQAESYHSQMKTLYGNIKTLPKGLSDDDKDELEELRDAAIELYNIYTEYYELATNPSGSYNSYSADNSEKTDEYISSYKALANLLD